MDILIITAYFPPDNGSASNLFHDLATNLGSEGNNVTVITTIPQYHTTGNLDRYKGKLWVTETQTGLTVHRIRCPRFEGLFKIGRGFWQLWVTMALSIVSLILQKRDVCLIYSPPLPLCLAGYLTKKVKGTKLVLNIQDLVPQSIVDLGMMNNKSLIDIFTNLEQFCYNNADHITVMSQGNLEYIEAKNIAKTKLTVIENWVELPKPPKQTVAQDILRNHSLDNFNLITFGGVLGHSQDVDIIINAAKLTVDRPDILWIIIGDGVQKDYVLKSIAEYNLSNLRLLPMLPRNEYEVILANSKAGLATLKPIVQTPVVPSKIYSIMACGIPVLSAMPLSGDGPKLVSKINCGINISPGDHDSLAKSVIQLVDNTNMRDKLGENGIKYIKNHLNVSNATIKYQELFANLVK
jgi:glycosyltransferase involved in cell wall biosynthesis|tara:strand:- start:277 stop:1500 length:1224 start_codon:yes stop_codon:yes gene_type:complete